MSADTGFSRRYAHTPLLVMEVVRAPPKKVYSFAMVIYLDKKGLLLFPFSADSSSTPQGKAYRLPCNHGSESASVFPRCCYSNMSRRSTASLELKMTLALPVS